jgi:cysteinyl-tRNA synthetase
LDAFAALRQEVRQLAKDKASSEKMLEAVDRATPAIAAARKAGLEDCAASFETFATDLRAAAGAGGGAVLQRCDQVRDEDFARLGVRLEDRITDFLWMFEDSEVLAREATEKAEKAAAASRAKVANKLTQKKQEVKSAEKASVKPEELFKSGANSGLYAEFDDNGVPTKLAGGEELSAKKRKDLQKELEKQKKDYDKFMKTVGPDGAAAFLEKLQKEVSELEAQL